MFFVDDFFATIGGGRVFVSLRLSVTAAAYDVVRVLGGGVVDKRTLVYVGVKTQEGRLTKVLSCLVVKFLSSHSEG